MTNKISVTVSMLCEETPEVMNTIQERFERVCCYYWIFSRRNHG